MTSTPKSTTTTTTTNAAPELDEETYRSRLIAEANRRGLDPNELPTVRTGSRDMMGDALRLVDAERGFTPPPEPEPEAESDPLLKAVETSLSGAKDLWQSVGGGIAKAGFETKDFLLGEPEESEKSNLRKEVEARSAALSAKSPANALASGVAQFATGTWGPGSSQRR